MEAPLEPCGDGRYVASRVFEGYSSLDLYLMACWAQQRSTLTLLKNPTWIPQRRSTRETRCRRARGREHRPGSGAMNSRQPDFRSSPKTFRVGFIFLTSPGVEPSTADLEAVDRVRRSFTATSSP